MRPRTWLLLVATVALAAAVVGTGGFTATDADRGVDVSVADDPNAYVAVTNTGVETTGSTTDATLLTVGNQAGEDLTVTVSVANTDGGADPDPTVENVSGPGLLVDGASGDVTGDVTCPSGGGTVDVTLDLSAEGTTVEASLTRTVTVDCTG